MNIFSSAGEVGLWQPSEIARGPFQGLQGGAVAGLLAGLVECAARENDWGEAVSAACWFLKPTPLGLLRTAITPVRSSGRVKVIDATVWPDREYEPSATARVTLLTARPIDVPQWKLPEQAIDPFSGELRVPRAPHGEPWFMDSMEFRPNSDISWFRPRFPIVAGAGALASVLGPADWAHGIARPVTGVVAYPNPNLFVQLVRAPRDEWIGVEASAQWRPETGAGVGGGILRDRYGQIGFVSMTVALTRFPKLT